MSTHVKNAAEREMVVRPSIEADDLDRLFASLLQEPCVHSWKNIEFESGPTLEELAEWENRRRPTELFFFYVERGDRLRLVAASAVAERLTHDFPHPGFCVLTRCYIMPEFRGQGLYRHVLRYRLERCRARFGDGLRGVHIGTVDHRVARSITTRTVPGWPTFVHLGTEELRVAGEVETVDDYMMLLPAYVDRLRHALGGPDAPACVVELRERLGTFDGDDPGDLGVFVKERFEEACAHGWFREHEPGDVEQLLGFCRSIPLVGFA